MDPFSNAFWLQFRLTNTSELQDVVWVKSYIKKDGVLLEEELVEEKKIDNTEIKEILDTYLLDNII